MCYKQGPTKHYTRTYLIDIKIFSLQICIIISHHLNPLPCPEVSCIVC